MINSNDPAAGVLVGIDLGTTNSEIAAFVDGQIRVLTRGNRTMLPSCVGLSPSGELLIGEPARNQRLLHPDRTLSSVKRKMGSDEILALGDRELTPPEVSALILKELVRWAEERLGESVTRAVITVPAYFSDAQRNATREAGRLAGLEVVRILNEPTAASLAYGEGGDSSQRTVLVYDLGGGTFDVSIVSIEGDVTEVLASHGNNLLGGDDFDRLLQERLVEEFRKQHGVDLTEDNPRAMARLAHAAEEAKKTLSAEPFARIREESLIVVDGKPLHLETEVSRDDYERLIRPLIDSTLESVNRALEGAGKATADIDEVLLVGGSTRTPLVARVMEDHCGREPRQEVHPDLCVALGAGVLASRLAGHEVERVLVDVSPYSFGPSHLGSRGGLPYTYCYTPIIKKNTPLPITRTERFSTAHPGQTAVDVNIYQGDDEDALKNILIGDFTIEGMTPRSDVNEVLCRMSLDLDGILRVTATERATGLSKQVSIQGATRQLTEEEILTSRKRVEELFLRNVSDPEIDEAGEDETPDESPVIEVRPNQNPELETARTVLEQSRTLLPSVHEEDREEMIDLNEKIEEAMSAGDLEVLSRETAALKELLFFVQGR